MKEEGPNRTPWSNRFVRRCGTVVRQTMEWMNIWNTPADARNNISVEQSLCNSQNTITSPPLLSNISLPIQCYEIYIQVSVVLGYGAVLLVVGSTSVIGQSTLEDETTRCLETSCTNGPMDPASYPGRNETQLHRPKSENSQLFPPRLRRILCQQEHCWLHIYWKTWQLPPVSLNSYELFAQSHPREIIRLSIRPVGLKY